MTESSMSVQEFAKSLSSLEYADDPDYEYLLGLLQSLLTELDVQVSESLCEIKFTTRFRCQVPA